MARELDLWETEYLHVLEGEDPVLEWVRGSALRPVLEALGPDEARAFEARYGAKLRAAYPRRADGHTLLPFRRIFMVARSMKYWILKSEPSAYSWDRLVADKRTEWSGVRNYQAANNLKAMKPATAPSSITRATGRRWSASPRSSRKPIPIRATRPAASSWST